MQMLPFPFRPMDQDEGVKMENGRSSQPAALTPAHWAIRSAVWSGGPLTLADARGRLGARPQRAGAAGCAVGHAACGRPVSLRHPLLPYEL